jgi:hypothetical protein
MMLLSSKNTTESSYSSVEDIKGGRKNMDQVKILQNEYIKNPDWTRCFMKQLSEKVGLKASQVYKWNWDKKKKEIEDAKNKRFMYPNEIFQIVDSNTGRNLTKPVFQKFTVSK